MSPGSSTRCRPRHQSWVGDNFEAAERQAIKRGAPGGATRCAGDAAVSSAERAVPVVSARSVHPQGHGASSKVDAAGLVAPWSPYYEDGARSF